MPNLPIDSTLDSSELTRARQISLGINAANVFTGAWLFAYPKPYAAVVAMGLIMPLLTLAALLLFPRLMRFQLGKSLPEDFRASLNVALWELPCIGLLIRALLDEQVLIYTRVAPIVAGVTIVIWIALISSSRQALRGQNLPGKAKVGLLIFSLLGTAIYGSGATLSSNRAFDNSSPRLQSAQVISKHMERGKGVSYFLTLTAWGGRPAGENIEVSRTFYHRISRGESVILAVKAGYWGIPWFTVQSR